MIMNYVIDGNFHDIEYLHFSAWSLYELWMLYITLAASVSMVIARIITGFVSGIIAIFRID